MIEAGSLFQAFITPILQLLCNITGTYDKRVAPTSCCLYLKKLVAVDAHCTQQNFITPNRHRARSKKTCWKCTQGNLCDFDY